MRKTLIALLVAACAATGLVACAKTPYVGGPYAPAGSVGRTADPQDQARAYAVVLEALYRQDTGLNGGTYLALDLSQVQLAETAPLVAQVRAFCASHGYTLMLDTFEGLQSKGYIKDLSFADGFLVGFVDVSLTEDTLVTQAQKWRSGLGAIGGKYTVAKRDGMWSITSVTGQWIS